MVTRKEWYSRVNATWPEGDLPALTADEAVRAAKKLYRFALGTSFDGPVRITSGNRYTWIAHGIMQVNPDNGWHRMVHDLSHLLNDKYQSDPNDRGHGSAHARMEIRLIKEVLKRGWLTGNLKDTPKADKPPVDARAVKHGRITDRIGKWEAKLNRAQKALKKLYKQQRYYAPA